jgi:hypothetical protein
MYQTTIIIDHDIDALEKLLAPEQKDLGRSSFTAKKDTKKHTLILYVKAEDATAFKTVMNTLAKIFIIWEAAKKIC